MAAGCLFTNGKHVLAGLQKKNDILVLSGFGGMIEPSDKNPLHGAIRETLEELFHIQQVPQEIINYFAFYSTPRRQFQNGDYSIFVYDFHDLTDWLHILRGFGMNSPLYNGMPYDISDLILNRKEVHEMEIIKLSLIPLKEPIQVSPQFQSDLKLFDEK